MASTGEAKSAKGHGGSRAYSEHAGSQDSAAPRWAWSLEREGEGALGARGANHTAALWGMFVAQTRQSPWEEVRGPSPVAAPLVLDIHDDHIGVVTSGRRRTAAREACDSARVDGHVEVVLGE